ncbi:heme-thiolate peroxidase [Leucocoprinus birnbaumii]|uniref:Heme-thiolate peroxidase n=1 Tax=Leucocoprinus birnbaumii TaxID=56174 RepID=A0AAD5VJ21_9AGAR|nr:heme-thiolate peroxidase [Leucocoprinus birnbaumii]
MSFIYKVFHDVAFFSWDTSLAIANLVLPSRAEGKVTPEGHPGFGGKWPEFVPRKEGDSRCSCPALNAMANHGILPHDGKNISFKDMNRLIRTTYNFSPSFCYFVPNFAAKFLKRDYNKDTFNLDELDLHNLGIEHDASLCREDAHFCPDQSVIATDMIKELLASASGKDKDGNPLLTVKDLSRFSAKRRVDSSEKNPEYKLDFQHKMFGSSNCSTMLTIFGGRVKDLETILLEERLPENWESRVRKPFGLTLAHFNLTTVMWVELGINEKKYIAERKAAEEAAASNEAEAEAEADAAAESSVHKSDSPTN